MVSYEQFLAEVNEADMAMLLSFAKGEWVLTRNAGEADALFAQATRLFTAKLVWRVVRGYEDKDPDVEYQFDGWVSPLAFNYITQAARERVIQSRQPPTT